MIRKEILLAYKEGKLTTEEVREKLLLHNSHSADEPSLTEGQKGLWMLHKLAPDMSAYHIPLLFRMRPYPQMDCFKEACLFMMDKFPVLRSVITEIDGLPYRKTLPSMLLDFTQEEIMHMNEQERDSRLQDKLHEPFQMEQGPLIRFHVMKESERSALILIVVHHIVFDGGSIQSFLNQLMQTYGCLVQGQDPGTDMIRETAGFAEFVEWESSYLRSERSRNDLAYWKQQCAGMPPVMDLRTDYLRPAKQSFAGAVYSFNLSPELSGKTDLLAKTLQVNKSVILLAVYNMLLYRYSGQHDITVGMPIARRGQVKFENTIGYMMNMIPVRSRNLNDVRFRELAKELQLTILDGIDHGDYPFPALVREVQPSRLPGYAPVVQVVFSYQNFVSSAAASSLSETYNKHFGMEIIDQVLQAGDHELELETYDVGGQLRLHFKYSPELFNEETIIGMSHHLEMLLQEVARDANLPLDEYSLLTEQEQELLHYRWNDTYKDYPLDVCFHEKFKEQAQRTPDSVAVTYKDASLTYKELDERSTELAIYLQHLGVKPNVLVGVCLERSLELIVSLMAVMKAGGAYVPLDPALPAERLVYMLENSKAQIVISHSSLARLWNNLGGIEARRIFLDEAEKEIQTVMKMNKLEQQVQTHHLAYVIYTSGSTGNPKGVMISHRALVNFLASMADEPGLHSHDRLLAVTTSSFDIAALELFLPLLQGAECCICAAEDILDPGRLMREIKRLRPTVMQGTPALWISLLEAGWTNEEQVTILCGGEAMTETLKRRLQRLNCAVYNLFGPTETTVWSTLQRMDGDEPVTIGRPIANTQIFIMDRSMQQSPIGVAGELCIAGEGLAQGYWQLPELTAEKFVNNPFRPGTLLYRTGDAARWLANGRIQHLGRMDDQLKIRGYRIETGEIEHHLRACPGVREAVVVAKEQDEHKQLAAYIVVSQDKTADTVNNQALRTFLGQRLPSYMIPSFYIFIDEIPLTPNGKTNRKLLEAEPLPFHRVDETLSRKDSVVDAILEIWGKLLPSGQLREDIGFFEAGGDSILAVTAVERMKNELGVEMSVTDLFKYGNAKSLSLFLSERKSASSRSGNNEVPVSSNESKCSDVGDDYPDYYESSLAVIGISCVFPGASDPHEFWKLLRGGISPIRYYTEEELDRFDISESIRNDPRFVPLRSTIERKEEFDPAFFRMSPRDAEMMDPQLRLLLMHAWKAVEDAGYAPESIPGTAVFMSASNSFYHASAFKENSSVMNSADEYVSWLMAQSGTIPTMISHKLGFTGPSLFVHSNCSSSLAGLHSAYQCIMAGEAQVALVGGATVFAENRAGYVHQPGLNFSSDGRIKAFDDSADGMVTGEGAAVIVVKNAAQAVRDGDRVYALVRDVSLNNDGADKVGFYAPSVKGQAEVIRNALVRTGIKPDSIDYVEAHGTGTKLGDPIEFAALCEAYGQGAGQKGHCGLGSVKTNIGHLDTAAGLAGLIKLALSLHHRELPPTLNFKNPNKHLRLEDSPFHITDRTEAWRRTETPRRGALSSFGIGGTNAHAILEEFMTDVEEENVSHRGNNGGEELVILSAKSEERLQVYASTLLGFIKERRSEIGLSDLAYTLQVGRTAMDSRMAIVASDMEALIQKLESFIENGGITPGCYVGELAQNDEVAQGMIRETDDHDALNTAISGGDLAKVAELWVGGVSVDWQKSKLHQTWPVKRISLPTYPFALRRYSLSVGHQFEGGEDRVENRPGILHPLLHRNESTLGGVRFVSSFSGEEFLFSEHKVKDVPVLPGVASLELAREAVCRAADLEPGSFLKLRQVAWIRPIVATGEKVDLRIALQPQMDDASTISYRIYAVPKTSSDPELLYGQGFAELKDTGEGIREMDMAKVQALCPTKEVENRKFYEAVRSMGVDYGPGYQGIKAIYRGKGCILAHLELPPSIWYTRDQYVLHPSMLDSAIQASIGLHQSIRAEAGTKVQITLPFALEELNVYRSCTDSMWAYIRYAEGRTGNVMQGPVQKLDISLMDENGKICVEMKGFTSRVLDETRASPKDPDQNEEKTVSPVAVSPAAASETVFFKGVWEPVMLNPDQRVPSSDQDVFIIAPDEEMRRRLLHLHPGAKELELLTDDTEDALAAKLRKLGSISHLIWAMPASQSDSVLNERLVEEHTNSILPAFRWVKALLKEHYGEKSLTWTVTTVQAQSVHKDDRVEPAQAAVLGLLATVAKEYPAWKVRVADWPKDGNWPLTDLFQLPFDHHGQAWAFRKGEWFKQRLLPVNMSSSDQSIYRKNGVYVVIGGAGGIGQIWTEYMQRHYNASVIWIGRRQIDEEISSRLARLNRDGLQPEYMQADAMNRDSLAAACEKVLRKYGCIHGVIQAALVLEDQLLAHMDESTFCSVLGAKAEASIRMAQVFEGVPGLDFMLFFSSVNGIFHPAGQGNYNAGSAFQDAYSIALGQELSVKVRTVNWGFWGSTGAVATPMHREMMQEAGIASLEPGQALDSLEKLLAGPLERVAVMELLCSPEELGIDMNEQITLYPSYTGGGFRSSSDKRFSNRPKNVIEREELEQRITDRIAALLHVGSEEIDKHTELSEYGWEAVWARVLVQEWEEVIALQLPSDIFNETFTISQIADRMLECIDDSQWQLSAETQAALSATAEREGKVEEMLCRLLLVQLQRSGLLERKNVANTTGYYDKWMAESLSLLERKNWLRRQGEHYVATTVEEPERLWKEWGGLKEQYRGSDIFAQIILVETMLRALPDILSGIRPATDVMFPDSSMALVQNVYQNNVIVDLYNEIVAAEVLKQLKELNAERPGACIKIVEVGAGTGGTTAKVLPVLQPYSKFIEEYSYTDISKAFLLHAEARYAPGHPYLKGRLLNVGEPLNGQDIEPGSYDLVIASNVLHATRDIRSTLRNVKALLKPGGKLILNEINSKTLFSHLTFGLLEGWWLYEDEVLRLPGCPALTTETWSRLLIAEGFLHVNTPCHAAGKWGQQVIVSHSDGVIRQKIHTHKLQEQGGAISLTIQPDQVKTQPSSDKTNPIVAQQAQKEVKRIIRESVCAALRMDENQINDHESFSDYGVDSIVAVNLVNELNQKLGISLATTAFFDYSNVERLTLHIVEIHDPGITAAPNEQIPIMPPVERERLHNPPNPPNSGSLPTKPVRDFEPYHEAVAIIGMSGRFANSSDVDELWAHLAKGDDLVKKASRWNLSDHVTNDRHCEYGSFLDELDRFDPHFFNISDVEATYMDPRQRIFLEEAWHALEDAGYAGSSMDGSSCGVYVGCGRADYDQLFSENPPPQAFWGNDSSVIPARISYFLNLQGPAVAIDTACSSSLVAIHTACQGLWSGEISMALAGGVYLNCTPGIYIVGNKAEMLSPTGRCSTFDQAADGFVPGEGAGVVVLKKLDDAVADGDQIYGIIRGIGMNQDGRTNGITAPSALSQERLERSIYEKFSIDPRHITMVEAHGTGTKLGDPIEFGALTKTFRAFTEDKGYCAIGSIKTNLGHTAHTAGVAGVLKILLSMRHKQIPPTLHYKTANSAIPLEDSPFYVNTSLRDWEPNEKRPRQAAVSSFGFSGTNAHVVIEEGPHFEQTVNDRPAYLVVISSNSSEQLQLLASKLLERLNNDDSLCLGDISFTLLMGRRHMPFRLASVVRTKEELMQQLDVWLKKGKAPFLHQSVIHDREVREQTALKRFGNYCINQCTSMMNGDEYAEELAAIADLFLQGYSLDYGKLFIPGIQRRVSLPTTPFANKKYWINNPRKFAFGTVSKQPHPDEFSSRAYQAANQCADTITNREVDPAEMSRWIQSNSDFNMLDRLGQCMLMGAFHRMEVFRNQEEWERDSLRARLQIIPKYHRLFEALLHMLQKAGFIDMQGGKLMLVREWTPEKLLEEVERLRCRLQEREELSAHVHLLTKCIEAYPEILTGKCNHMEIMFPEGSDELVKNIYKDTEGIDFYSRTLATMVQAFIQERLASDPRDTIRILEIGAGTGGTSRFMFSALEPYGERIQYLYTDISSAFTKSGEREFAGRYPFAKFGVLDIERPIAEQGHEMNGVDVVIASNVLHATRNISSTLKRVRSLLNREGALFLLEITRAQDFNTLIFGLTGGWWLFDDGECRLPGTPVLDAASWTRCLMANGFREVRAVNLVQTWSEEPFQHLILAKLDAQTAENEGEGRIDNHDESTAPMAAASAPSTIARNSLEERISSLWKEILGIEEVHIHDHFQDLGGDSLMLTQLISRLKKSIPFEIDFNPLYGVSTVAEMAEFVEEELLNRIEELPEERVLELLV